MSLWLPDAQSWQAETDFQPSGLGADLFRIVLLRGIPLLALHSEKDRPQPELLLTLRLEDLIRGEQRPLTKESQLL